MADKKKMSVEEMLAAARAEKGGGAAASSPKASTNGNGEFAAHAAAAPGAGSSEAEAVSPPKPAAKKPTAGMSVADMLAAARGEKAGGAKPAEPKPTAPKPAAAATATATKAPPKPVAEKSPAGPVAKDTASILAAARRTTKPGPVSKAEIGKAETAKPAKSKLAVPPMPEKPAYARPVPAVAPTTVARRSFLGGLTAALAVLFQSSLAVGFTSMAVTGLLWVLGLARYMFPNVLIEPPTKFKVGFPDDYGPGQVQTKFIPQFGVWIVRYEWEGQPIIYALKAVCTHLGCTPSWLEGEQKFKCPCHGSGFYKDGVNFEGPAPRPLERYAINRADDGQLEVDKSRTFQEELGQWKDTASYVPV